jgi:quercetin dioxygenase-like cupin family protein
METRKLDTALLDVLEKDGYENTFMTPLLPASNEFLVKHFRIEKSGKTSSHHHAHEQLHYIVSGKGLLRTKTGAELLEPGMLLLIQADELHGFENPFDEDFEFLAFFREPTR